MCSSFNRSGIKGTNSLKICVHECMRNVYMSVLFHVCVGIGFVDWFEEGFMQFNNVKLKEEIYAFACDSLIVKMQTLLSN